MLVHLLCLIEIIWTDLNLFQFSFTDLRLCVSKNVNCFINSSHFFVLPSFSLFTFPLPIVLSEMISVSLVVCCKRQASSLRRTNAGTHSRSVSLSSPSLPVYRPFPRPLRILHSRFLMDSHCFRVNMDPQQVNNDEIRDNLSRSRSSLSAHFPQIPSSMHDGIQSFFGVCYCEIFLNFIV